MHCAYVLGERAKPWRYAASHSLAGMGGARRNEALPCGQMAVCGSEGGVGTCGGLALFKRTLANHGARALQELAPGDAGAQTGLLARLSLSATRQALAWLSRPCVQIPPQDHLRSRLLLASSSEVFAGAHAQVAA